MAESIRQEDVNIKVIVLVEKPEDFLLAQEYVNNHQMDASYIALTPFATAELEKAKVPHKTAIDYPGREERYNEGLKNYPRINSITEMVDKELLPIHQISTLQPAQYPFYYLKILFDVLSSTVLLLNTIIDIEKPDVIICCCPETPSHKTGLFAFTDEDSVFSEVLSLMSKLNKATSFPDICSIRKSQSQSQSVTLPKGSPRENMVKWIRSNEYLGSVSFIYNLGLVRKQFGLISALDSCIHYILPGRRLPVLIYEYGYNWEDILPMLVQHGFRPIIRLDDFSIDQFNTEPFEKFKDAHKTDVTPYLQNILTTGGRFREYVIIGGVDLSDIIFPKMATIISRSLTDSERAYRIFGYLNNRTPFKAVLLSVHTHSKSYAVMQAASDAGAYVISWQHGGAGYSYQPLIPYIEFFKSDYHFVYGEGVKSSYLESIKNSGFKRSVPEIVPIGSSSFDKMRVDGIPISGESKEVKSVLYVTTNYYRNGYYISNPEMYPIDYDIQIWYVQKAVLDLANRNPGCVFTIKLHPTHTNCQPLKDYADRNHITNVKFVISEKTLVELVRSADITLFDLVSTGILQAMTSDKPIFVYGGAFKIGDDALKSLVKRVYYAESIDSFISSAERCITGLKFPESTFERNVNVRNHEFLNEYGNKSDDGKSVDRAIAFLTNKIIKIP